MGHTANVENKQKKTIQNRRKTTTATVAANLCRGNDRDRIHRAKDNLGSFAPTNRQHYHNQQMKTKTTWKNLTKQNHKYELIKSGMIKQQQKDIVCVYIK